MHWTIIWILLLYLPQDFVECEVYVSQSNEVIVISDNILSYRLKNKGGIITYSYFTGQYQKNGSKYILFKDQNSYAFIERRPDTVVIDNSIRICFYSDKRKPIKYAPIFFEPSNYLMHQKFYTGDSGCISISINPLIDSLHSRFQVQMLGYSFPQDILIRNGEEHSIILKVSNKYGIQNTENSKREWLKIKSIGKNQLRVYDSVKKNWSIFEKISSSGICHESIFRELP